MYMESKDIRLLSPEGDPRVKAYFKSVTELMERVDNLRGRFRPTLFGESYYSDTELAAKLKVSRRSLQDYRNNGTVPFIRLGGKVLYRRSDVERILRENYSAAL